MFKFLKVASLSILCFLISTTSVIPISADQSDLDIEYKNIISNRKTTYSRSSTLDSHNLEELRRHNVDEDFYLFFEAFSGTNFIDYLSTNAGSIVINEDSGFPILIDGSIDNQLRILIGYEEYNITTEDNGYGVNLLLEHPNGKSMYLHEETYYNVDTMMTDNSFSINSRAASYWLPFKGGVKGQTGSWLIVLGLALEAAGWVAKFNHGIVGTVLKVVGTVVTVGSLYYVTLYTEIFQSQRSDCRSYIQQQKNFYNYNNYTKLLKIQTTYFHSVRPDYVGGACMGY